MWYQVRVHAGGSKKLARVVLGQTQRRATAVLAGAGHAGDVQGDRFAGIAVGVVVAGRGHELHAAALGRADRRAPPAR